VRTRNLQLLISSYLLFALYLDIAFAFAVSGVSLPLGTSDPDFGGAMGGMMVLGLVGLHYLNRQRRRQQANQL